MNDPANDRPEARRRSRRLRALVVGLALLASAYLIATLRPEILRRETWFPRPLDSCLTEEAVKRHLDTRVAFLRNASGAWKPIILGAERISNLVIRAGAPPTVHVRFTLDHGGRKLPVEGSFPFTGSDSPDLHYHLWGDFHGQVVAPLAGTPP